MAVDTAFFIYKKGNIIMNDILKRLDGETENQMLWRLGKAKASGVLGDATWPDIAKVMNKEFREDETQYYDSSAYRKRYKNFSDAFDEIFSKNNFTNEQLIDIEEKLRELEKAKIKVQTEKLEYKRWLREEARDEMIADKICSAIRESNSLIYPKPIVTNQTAKSGILAFGDEHYAAEFTIYGLYGEIINSYSPEIFEQRMWKLFYKTIEVIRKEELTTLYVFALGDFTDGILRCSQLMKLRYGVVEGTVRYAKFISNWLNELSKYVKVKYQMVYGNHSELRMLGQPKGTFKEENTGMFVREMISIALEGNPNFEMIMNPTGLIFDNIEGFNVLGIHGEVRNMESAIKDFSNTYNTDINILIGGHMHHFKAETVGINREVINVPSIIGVDDYSMTLNKTSNPGATLLVVENDIGVSVEYKIKL
jgi:predicted phosphodiesterase